MGNGDLPAVGLDVPAMGQFRLRAAADVLEEEHLPSHRQAHDQVQIAVVVPIHGAGRGVVQEPQRLAVEHKELPPRELGLPLRAAVLKIEDVTLDLAHQKIQEPVPVPVGHRGLAVQGRDEETVALVGPEGIAVAQERHRGFRDLAGRRRIKIDRVAGRLAAHLAMRPDQGAGLPVPLHVVPETVRPAIEVVKAVGDVAGPQAAEARAGRGLAGLGVVADHLDASQVRFAFDAELLKHGGEIDLEPGGPLVRLPAGNRPRRDRYQNAKCAVARPRDVGSLNQGQRFLRLRRGREHRGEQGQ